MLSKFNFGSGLITVGEVHTPQLSKILVFVIFICYVNDLRLESFLLFRKITRVTFVQKTRLELTYPGT